MQYFLSVGTTEGTLMLRRHFISTSWFRLSLVLSSVTLSISLILNPHVASAETPWESSGNASVKTRSIAAKKKKKTKKRMRAASHSGRRSLASTSARSRYLAQSDLESDLGEGDLEAELARESDEPATAEAPIEPVEPVVAATAGDEVQIQDIQYDSKKDGGTVIIATTGAATYRTREIPSQNQVVVEIANAKLPDRLKRPFNTKDFKQAIVSINAYQESGSNTARVVFQFRQPRSVDVRQNGTTLTVVTTNGPGSSATSSAAIAQNSNSDDFGDEEAAESATTSENTDLSTDDSESSDSSAPPILVGGSRSNREARESSGGETATRATIASGSGKILPSSTLEQERTGEIRFYGKPISIEVRDTPVRDVITLISDQSGANIIISDDVQGAITIKLRQVPWDQALSIIMKTRGLGYVRQGAVLRIAPVRQLQAEAEEARRIIEAQEATLPLRVKVIPVSFASVTLLTSQIRNTLQTTNSSSGGGPGGPGAQQGRGRIEADPRSSSLIITDTDENIRRIEQLVKALDTAPLQVMIEGKIVEAKESAGRRLGINWGYQGQDLGFAGGTLSHSASIAPTIGAANTTLDLKLGTLDFLGDLNAKLSLFESESVAKIISSPRVITMNNQAATISQSVQIPIPSTTTTIGSAPQTTITYRPIPTTLAVTPQITSGGDVLMQISFTREFKGESSGENVAIESRDIKTNVMVKNGQTTVIGGIYQSDQVDSEQGTPFLRNIPVLGWLFKSTDKSSVRNELLVFITPRILNADRTLPKAGTVQ
jgi:type IV pilus assembly protein PilQ